MHILKIAPSMKVIFCQKYSCAKSALRVFAKKLYFTSHLGLFAHGKYKAYGTAAQRKM